MSSENYHEPVKELSDATREMHRAIQTAIEELDAIDWYQQRVDVTKDDELKNILKHNSNEEKEHFAMAIEWMRRKDKELDKQLNQYLFTDKPITKIED